MKQQMKAKGREGSSLRKEMRNLKKRKNTCTMVDLPGIGMNLQIDPLLESLCKHRCWCILLVAARRKGGKLSFFLTCSIYARLFSCGRIFFLET